MKLLKTHKIYVAGHRGLVGSALIRDLETRGYANILTRTHSELDLSDQKATFDFLEGERPDAIILAAARVGGIQANNTYRGEFIYQNLAIASNVIHGAHLANTNTLLFLGSSCIYPKHAPQPMKEEHLLTGSLEPTNEPYAVAKIAGLKLCEAYHSQFGRNYFSVMPTNLYGIGDNFDLENSHVLPALLRKFHEAKLNGAQEVVMWGTGTPRREFLYSDDLADACIHLLETQDAHSLGNQHINVGVGQDISIRELAELIKEIVGYEGEIVQDLSKPDGTPRKLLNVDRLKSAGWTAKTSLKDGIDTVYQWYLTQV